MGGKRESVAGRDSHLCQGPARDPACSRDCPEVPCDQGIVSQELKESWRCQLLSPGAGQSRAELLGSISVSNCLRELLCPTSRGSLSRVEPGCPIISLYGRNVCRESAVHSAVTTGQRSALIRWVTASSCSRRRKLRSRVGRRRPKGTRLRRWNSKSRAPSLSPGTASSSGPGAERCSEVPVAWGRGWARPGGSAHFQIPAPRRGGSR